MNIFEVIVYPCGRFVLCFMYFSYIVSYRKQDLHFMLSY